MPFRRLLDSLKARLPFFQAAHAPSISTLSIQVLKKYRNPIFLETGTFHGDGVQMALDAGFKRVITVEVDDTCYADCCRRFAGNPKVIIHHGDSLELLPKMIASLDAPATFWLDGHGLALEPGKGGGRKNCPILEELQAIGDHPIKTHTILIDDRRMFGDDGTIHHDITGADLVRCWGVHEEEVFAGLIEINPAYKITFEDGFEAWNKVWRKDDIIVASV